MSFLNRNYYSYDWLDRNRKYYKYLIKIRKANESAKNNMQYSGVKWLAESRKLKNSSQSSSFFKHSSILLDLTYLPCIAIYYISYYVEFHYVFQIINIKIFMIHQLLFNSATGANYRPVFQLWREARCYSRQLITKINIKTWISCEQELKRLLCFKL